MPLGAVLAEDESLGAVLLGAVFSEIELLDIDAHPTNGIG